VVLFVYPWANPPFFTTLLGEDLGMELSPSTSGSLEDWLRPEGMTYQGFLFPRPATWPAYQKLSRCNGDIGMGCEQRKG